MTINESGHHRINERLNDYWEQLRGKRDMPLESDVVIDDLKDIWDHCFLVSIKDGKFSYSYLGDDLIAAYGENITGKEITETLVYPHPTSLLKAFSLVESSGLPKIDDSEFVNSRGTTVKYRSCVLPLAAPGNGGVAYLLGGMKWKAF